MADSSEGLNPTPHDITARQTARNQWSDVSPESRFWPKVDRGGDCWLWSASKFRNGYGLFRLKGRLVGAHRASWGFTNGSIPIGLYVCHRCDVRACVNPAHLFLGTAAENVADRDTKGRTSRGDKASSAIRTAYLDHPETFARGDTHGRRKLTASGVLEIRASKDSNAELAKKFGVSDGAIRMVRNRQTWRHI